MWRKPTQSLTRCVVQAALAAVALFAQAAAAQEAGTEEWFRKTWREASEWKPPHPIHLRAEFEHQSYIDEAQLKRLRALGPGISATEKRELDQLERQAAHPSYKWIADVATDGQSIRYSAGATPMIAPISFVISNDADWLLEGSSLKLASKHVDPPEYGVRNFMATGDSVVRTAVWAGLGDPLSQLTPVGSGLVGQKWRGEIGRNGEGPPVSLVEGTLALPGQPGVDGMRISRRMLADENLRKLTPLGTIEYVEWGTCEGLERPVVNKTRWVDGAGRATQTMNVLFLRSIPVDEFASLLKPPASGVQDQWLGSVSLSRVQDVRPGQESENVIENGVARPVPMQLPLDAADQSRSVFRWYVAAGLGAAALILAWLLRKH